MWALAEGSQCRLYGDSQCAPLMYWEYGRLGAVRGEQGYNLTGNLQWLLEASSAFIIECMSGTTFFFYWKEKMKGFCFNSTFYCCVSTPTDNDDMLLSLVRLGTECVMNDVSQSSQQLWYWLRTEICKTERGPLITSSWNSEVWNFLLSLHKIKSYC